ncbi:hypothetical conserved protein [Candidatus Nitrosoglobus terrae]|uniref:Hypothetical conserved protein n=1 Tax=Candidatus Nitrosoglobus terrae TaxID=1630141 RepID=A0A1Q2SJZ8_9GAMM|nr:hypothetical protein [Candidatus Nitrosoglobus terrae]BAW79449.1 hypothetical conserved protein [Candidatus Nitrosoglobus terrae]
MFHKILPLALGSLVSLIAMELVLRVLPTPTATHMGQYIDPFITTYPPNFEFQSATGWDFLNPQRQRSNEFGFIPNRSFSSSLGAVALIGDSLVEQSMLAPSDRLAAKLENERNGVPVFSLGIPGSSLFDYLERVRFAYDTLGIRKFWIVVERADVHQSLCEHASYTDVCLDKNGELFHKKKLAHSALRDLLAHSAILQYFFGVLRLSAGTLTKIINPFSTLNMGANVTTVIDDRPSPLSSAETQVVKRFFQDLTSFSSIKAGIVLDPQVGNLNRSEEFISPALESMYKQAIATGIAVIHPFQDLKQYSDSTRLEMRVGPYDAHWNARANIIIAKAILRDAPM